jgi:hypothetical protein
MIEARQAQHRTVHAVGVAPVKGFEGLAVAGHGRAHGVVVRRGGGQLRLHEGRGGDA